MRKRLIFTILFIALFFVNSNKIYGEFGNISENSAIVLDGDSSSILYSKNINEKIFPASTTKILTAILAIENLNLNTLVTVTKDEIDSIPYGSSIMYLKAGDVLTVKDLLYGLLLSSGNDAAIVLADTVSGSVPNFVKLMNNKLKELNCIHSHFTNPHGFHDDNHFSTAYDMALLMKYASHNEAFREICETDEYLLKTSNITRKLENTDLLLSSKLEYTIGGKTGYTDEAGNVFICYSKFEGKNIVCGVFDGSKNILNKTTRFNDTKKLLDYSYENYGKQKVLDKNTFKISYVDKKTNKHYILGIDEDIYCLSDRNEYTLNYDVSNISINDDDVYGDVYVSLGNSNWKLTDNYKLKLIETKKYIGIDGIKYSTILVYILLILIILVIILNNKKKKLSKKLNKKKTNSTSRRIKY